MLKIIIGIIIVTCSFSVSIPQMSLFNDILVLGFGICTFPMVIANRNNKNLLLVMGLWLLPFLLSLVISFPYNVFFKLGSGGLNYSQLEPYGRIVNLFAISIFMLCMNYLCFINKSIKFSFILKCYYYTCCLILLSVIWQALDLYLGIPIKFPIETRSYIHGNVTEVNLSSRLTGYAMEPSYLAPFLIEFIIFSFFLLRGSKYRNLALLTGIVLLFLTYSPSSYITFFIICMVFLLYKYRMKFVLISILPIILGSFLFSKFRNINAFEYLYERVIGIENSSRYTTIKNAVTFMIENDMFTLLLGNGIKSFSLLHTVGGDFRTSYETSNNLFIDVFFECGAIGLSILIFFFIYSLKKILTQSNSKYTLFALLLWVDVVLSAMFRADYATLRVFILLYFIFVFTNYSKNLSLKEYD
ncbi:O-antigen ligase family protein [Myroides odoratimimus]|uniref:O-antigen ligase family protein n=1 Tax=Myroides odoratimimus TaxID=76832 RepID=UPI002576D09F|nr:O-antigen ligase family protein [Myroides odoratimimus]MDM1450401.1 O-antigen ligase family protein [Myroides odoratimimus]